MLLNSFIANVLNEKRIQKQKLNVHCYVFLSDQSDIKESHVSCELATC